MLKLRDHQKEIFPELKINYQAGHNFQCVQAATGYGKTAVACHIINKATQRGLRTLFLAHKKELITQGVSSIYKFSSGKIEAGIIMSGYQMTHSKVQVASIQTIIRRVKKIKFIPDIIIIDEAHHSRSNTYTEILKYYFEQNPRLRVFGFTATPLRLDGKPLNPPFTALVQGKSMQWLVDNNYLCNPILLSSELSMEDTKLKRTKKMGDDYDNEEQQIRFKKLKIVGDTIDQYKKYFVSGDKQAPVIGYGITVEHCEWMAEKCRNAGIRSGVVHANSDPKERTKLIKGLASGKVSILWNVDILTEGVDVPAVAGVVLLRRSKSLTWYLQAIGRAVRTAPGKTHAIVLDPVGNVYEHGHPLIPRNWTLEGKPELQRGEGGAKIKQCWQCGAWHPNSVQACGICDADLRDNPMNDSSIHDRITYIHGDLDAVGVDGVKIDVDALLHNITDASREACAKAEAEKQLEQDFYSGCSMQDMIKHIDYLCGSLGVDKSYLQKTFDRLRGK